MMTEPTIEKLRALKLYAMTTAWILQRTDPSMGGVCQTSCRLNLQAALPTVVETVIAGRSGLRWTTEGRAHGRTLPVQRSGCFAWACA